LGTIFLENKMKKVFIIHGFEGSPNGGWRPWLMAELEQHDVYACALSMPNPDNPLCWEWVEEISRHVERNENDEIYLIGHSLGGPVILRFLEKTNNKNIYWVILVSSPSEKNTNRKLHSFLESEFDFGKIRKSAKQFIVIHGDNDQLVPVEQAVYLADTLNSPLILIKNGGHLNGSVGWFSLPECF